MALDLKARGLVAHQAPGFREWGASASLAWDPRPSTDRGLALTLRQSWGGSPTGGMEALFARETLAGLRLRSGGLIVKIERGGRAVQIRVANDAPLLAGGGIRLRPEIGHELPVALARAADLLDVLGPPPPWVGRGRWAKKGNF